MLIKLTISRAAAIAAISLVALASMAAIAPSGGDDASGPDGGPPRITLMTWNIYYGGGDDGGVPGMADLWDSMEATDFAERASRIARIIDNVSGRMLEMKHPCIILRGVDCSGEFQRFGAQNEYVFWREIWLERVASAPNPADADTASSRRALPDE